MYTSYANQRVNHGYRGGYGSTGGRGKSAANAPEDANINHDYMRHESTQDTRLSALHSTTSAEYLNNEVYLRYNNDAIAQIAFSTTPVLNYVAPIILTNAGTLNYNRLEIRGGNVIEVSDRVNANISAIREEQKDAHFRQIGVDVEYDNNMFEDPEKASRIVDMTMQHNIRNMQNYMCNVVLEEMISKGTKLPDLLLRANPAVTLMSAQSKLAAKRQSEVDLFGIINRQQNIGLDLLFAQVSSVSKWAVTSGETPVIILPHPIAQNMQVATVRGSTIDSMRNRTLTYEMDNVFRHLTTNVNVIVHQPTPTGNSISSMSPEAEPRGLVQEIPIGIYYYIPPYIPPHPDESGKLTYRIPCIENGSWKIVESETYPQLFVRPRVTCITSSIIHVIPGEDTVVLGVKGEKTKVGISSTGDQTIAQLRVRIAPAIRMAGNIITVDGAYIHGIANGHGQKDLCEIKFNNLPADETPEDYIENMHTVISQGAPIELKEIDKLIIKASDEEGHYDYYNEDADMQDPEILYPGLIEVQHKGMWKTYQENTGHLKSLEDPRNPAIRGLLM